jgi:hypothetical protein
MVGDHFVCGDCITVEIVDRKLRGPHLAFDIQMGTTWDPTHPIPPKTSTSSRNHG